MGCCPGDDYTDSGIEWGNNSPSFSWTYLSTPDAAYAQSVIDDAQYFAEEYMGWDFYSPGVQEYEYYVPCSDEEETEDNFVLCTEYDVIWASLPF